MEIGIDALKQMTLGQIKKHHEFMGAELKDIRRNTLNTPALLECFQKPEIITSFNSNNKESLIPCSALSNSPLNTSNGEKVLNSAGGSTPFNHHVLTTSQLLDSCEGITNNWDIDLASDNISKICREMK